MNHIINCHLNTIVMFACSILDHQFSGDEYDQMSRVFEWCQSFLNELYIQRLIDFDRYTDLSIILQSHYLVYPDDKD